MSATRITNILRAAGIVPVVPVVPASSARTGTAKAVVLQRVPRVPVVPAANDRPRREHSRVVVNFRFPNDALNAWATCIGGAGDSRKSIVASLRARWPTVEIVA